MTSRTSSSSPSSIPLIDTEPNMKINRLSGLEMMEDLLPEGKTVLARDLPNFIAQYELINSHTILSVSEKEMLKGLAEDMPLELEVGSYEVGMLLKQLIQTSTPAPTPTTESRPNNSRRTSTSYRIRSSSDLSSTDDSDGSSVRAASETVIETQIGNTHTPIRGLSFPTPDSAGPFGNLQHRHPPPSYIPPTSGERRVHTTSDPSKPPTALFQRSGTAPPSSFARPSPAGRRSRRTSEGTMRDMDDGTPLRSTSAGYISTPTINRPKPPGKPSHRRRSSVLSSTGGSSTFSPDFNAVRSPISPLFVGARGDSPDLMVLERMEGESDDENEGDDGIHGRLHDTRLARITKNSTTSLQVTHDQMEALRKVNAEHLRKNQELQRQLQAVGADNDQRIADLQDRLEEMHNELAIKKKEEKDLRIKEKTQNIQLASFEAELQNMQRSLELAKASQVEMNKSYQGQLNETERLRDTVLDRDQEIATQRGLIEGHEGENMQLEESIEAARAQISQLENSLAIARQAEVELNRQKQENLSLKETISRLNYDIDEMRIAGSIGHGRAQPASLAGTTSKNLGDEIARSLKADQQVNKQIVEVPGPGRTEYRTITYVTERFIQNPDGTQGATQVFTDETVRDYVDAGVETDRLEMVSVPTQTDLSMTSVLPPYSPQPTPTLQEILESAHPALLAIDGNSNIIELEADYANLSIALGKRCHVMEKQLAMLQSNALGSCEHTAAPSSKISSRRTSRSVTSTKDVVHMINSVVSLATTPERMWIIPASFVMATLLGYLVGYGQGAPSLTRDQLSEILLMRDFSNFGTQEHLFLAGTWALKGFAGGAKQAIGRTPM